MGAWARLMMVEGGDEITVEVDDFDNTRHPKEQNPREISGTVKNVAEDVNYAAGEIQRVVTIGNPWEDGCNIDVGDTSENNLTGGHNRKLYTKAWRPRTGKDRILLGKITEIQ